MHPHRTRVARPAVELFRLIIVVFGAELGYLIAQKLGAATGSTVLGPFDGLWIGVIVGSGLGYALGGILGRTTVHAVDQAVDMVRSRSAEQMIAGAIGAVIGVIVGAALAWPVFLLGARALSFPIFGFVVLTTGMFGYRIGLERRQGLFRMFGAKSGLDNAISASALPRAIDTSVAIDGRILEVVRAGFLSGRMVVPTFVLLELQGLADAGDDLRRSRGRRGLDVLEALKRERTIDVEVDDHDYPEVHEVDGKLVRMCLDRELALLTLDTNLAKVSSLAGVRVLNLHALALALRPPVVAGDEVSVLVLKHGKEQGQGVGYLDDGTMVVVEGASELVGHDAHVHVTSVLTTANGRMVFGGLVGEPATSSHAAR
jgi:uncharacterized protein YacL